MAVKDNSGKSASPKRKGRDIRASRRATGVNVAISIAVATCLLIIANVISQIHSYRGDVQMLGRYGLSPTAKAILAEIDKPVRLTSMYTCMREQHKGEKYLPQVRDLLTEIKEAKDNVTVVNVTTDRQKAEVLTRLRKRIEEEAKDHRQVIADFQIFANAQAKQYSQMAKAWAEYPATGWLAQFRMGKAIEKTITLTEDAFGDAANEIRLQLSGAALPDFAGMREKVVTVLKKAEDCLKDTTRCLRELSAIPPKARQARPELVKAASAVVDSMKLTARRLGEPGSAIPADVPKALTTFVADAAVATKNAQQAFELLVSFSQDDAQYVYYARGWSLERTPLPFVYLYLAETVDALAKQVERIPQSALADPKNQTETIERLRQDMQDLGKLAVKCGNGLDQLMGELTQPDKATQELLAQANKPDYLQAQMDSVKELLERAEKLGQLKAQEELIQKIGGDNTVIVEVGDKTGVVTFDEVWPLAGESPSMQSDPQQEQRRSFYGDVAICSRMLSMTAEPFAEVVLTFYEDITPFAQQRRPVVGAIPSIYLRTLRERLQKANLEVTEWNLAEQSTPPQTRQGRPQVLLVLPPPEPLPYLPQMGQREPKQWSNKDVLKLKRVIDGGTGAIFLTGYVQPKLRGGPPAYPLANYLREQWDLDVKSSLRVVQGQPDPVNPGTYEMPVLRWFWLPLSGFTNHPIGRPLRARRLYWLHVCPVVPAGGQADNVNHEDILVAPVSPPGTWASANPDMLAEKITEGGRRIKPAPEAGDLLGPFAVAAYARKKVQDKTAQVVVLGVGISYIDFYLNNPVSRLGGDVLAKPEPPPTGDVDLVINSVYYLIGRNEFIGAGPADIQPIQLISPPAMIAIKICFGLLWPLVVLGAGGVVMIMRRS